MIWTELGIAPTPDARLIRRAYAARLKSFDPDAEPERFQRLRQAYEAALHRAKRPSKPEAPPQLHEDEGVPASAPSAAPAAAPAPIAAPSVPEPDRVLAGIAARFNQGETLAAVEALDRALQGGALPLGYGEAAAETVLIRGIEDPTVPVEALLRLAQRIGWDQITGAASWPARQARDRLFARLDAEAWHGRITAVADRSLLRQWRHRRLRHAIRLLLGRSPRWTAYLVDRSGPMRDLMPAYDLHAPWIGDRFDPKQVAWCRRRIAGRRLPLTPGRILVLLIGLAMAIQNPRLVVILGGVFTVSALWHEVGRIERFYLIVLVVMTILLIQSIVGW